MFPFRYSSLFRSRWKALLWAAGIIWTAIDVSGSAPHAHAGGDNAVVADGGPVDASGAPVDAEQTSQAQRLLEQFGK